ncbi:MAG: Bax inhibitor-1/YccA family protein [Saprospiraceae bacterium]
MAFRNRFQSSSNPFMKEEVMRNSSQDVLDADMTNAHLITEKMTVSGAVNKSFILFGIMLLTSAISFQAPSQMLMLIGIFGGLGIVIFASFKRHLSVHCIGMRLWKGCLLVPLQRCTRVHLVAPLSFMRSL